MNDDRTIRDRLAEALFSATFGDGYVYADAYHASREGYLAKADRLLTALQSPTVKLKIEGAE